MDKPTEPSEVSASSMASVNVQPEPENQGKRLSYKSVFKIVVILCIVVGLVLGLTIGDLDKHIGTLLEWLDDNRVEGIAIFIGTYTALTGLHPGHRCAYDFDCEFVHDGCAHSQPHAGRPVGTSVRHRMFKRAGAIA